VLTPVGLSFPIHVVFYVCGRVHIDSLILTFRHAYRVTRALCRFFENSSKLHFLYYVLETRWGHVSTCILRPFMILPWPQHWHYDIKLYKMTDVKIECFESKFRENCLKSVVRDPLIKKVFAVFDEWLTPLTAFINC